MGKAGETDRPVNFSNLTDAHGEYTKNLLDSLARVQVVGAREASSTLIDAYPYFNERLRDYVCERAGTQSDESEAKAFLREASRAKGLSISSSNLSQWFNPAGKLEYHLAPHVILKLCLAMELDLGNAARFVYSCLHQNWFNYRAPDELVYCYFLGMQGTFGNETYQRACDMAKRVRSIPVDAGDSEKSAPSSTGYTRVIETDLQRMLETTDLEPERSAKAFEDYVAANSLMFTRVKKSGIRLYHTFFDEGGIGIKPLVQLYREAEGRELPKTSYLDPRDTRTISSIEQDSDKRRKRLLWGADLRESWLDRWDKDYDVLHPSEIKIEHHDVEKMDEKGVLRGNLIATLFFHFSYENADALTGGEPRFPLFSRFYNTTNQMLDDCGMMPLHPRKMLDSLFLKSIAHSGRQNPISYLNDMLAQFYRE